MENHGFESAFGAEYRAQQRRLAWKYLGLIALAVVAVTLLRTYLLLGGVWRLIDLVLPGLILLLDLSLAFLHRGQQRWMARRFQFTGRGIAVQGRRGKEELIPWTSIVTVDMGTMAGFGQRSVPVLRCFLSASAWEKFTPNLRQSAEKTSMQDYYKLRKECFTLEYSPEREQAILSLWESLGGDERDESIDDPADKLTPDEEFQSSFSEDVAGFDSGFVFMNYFIGGLGVLGLLASWIFDKNDGMKLRNTLLMIVFILFLLAILNAGRKTARWLKSKTKIRKEGIYVRAPKEKERFIPWHSVVEVERRLMSVGKVDNLPVICCFESLSSQSRLDFEPKKYTQGQDFQAYYNLRDEVVTLSYTKDRMAKIRAFRRAALKKEQQLHEE